MTDDEAHTDREAGSRTCLVTGASRGIGREIALELGRRGATVVVNYRSSEDQAHEVADTITEMDGSGHGVPARADVADFDDVQTMRDAVHDSIGPIDVLVNNAGITRDRRFEKLSPEEWKDVIDVCLHGTFHCTSAFYDDIRDAENGRVVTVSSVIGKQGNVGQANYAAAKSGLFGFMRSLALELAPSGSTANCVAPGFTRTDMVEAVPDHVQDKLRSEIPLGRFADAEEVACAVAFLASEDSAYVTGEVLDVNGGIDL